MKSNRFFSKAICLLIAVMLMLVPVSVFASAEAHEHVNANDDGICDECAESLTEEPTVLDNVLASLKMFVIGMIGIFIVVGIIIIVIHYLTKVIDEAEKKKDGE